MIANAVGANVVGVDIADDKLALARDLGAVATVDANAVANVAEAVIALTGGGAHVSIDALGHSTTCFNSVSCLRKRGKHVQVGLTLAEHSAPPIPMSKVVANELELLGSHGMQAHRYGAMLDMVQSGKLRPERLIGARISLEDSIAALMAMDTFQSVGVTVVTRF
jgi:alcohol dehydrogenase